MKDYSYFGVAEDLNTGAKFLVESNNCNIHSDNIIMFTTGNKHVYAQVLHSAFLPTGSEEKAMLAEFGEIRKVEKIYRLAWVKKEEEIEDGN